MFVGAFYGSVFFQLDDSYTCNQNCYTDRLSVLYFGEVLMLMSNLDCMTLLHSERLVFYRERGVKVYGPLAYFITFSVPQMVIFLLSAAAYSIPLYYMVDLRIGADHFFWFLYFTYISCCAAFFMLMTVASFARTVESGMAILPPALLLNMCYSGYLMFIPSMPSWQGSWLPYLSYFRFGFQGLVLNELQNNDDLPLSGTFIDNMGFNTISVQGCAAILLLFFGGYALTFFLALRFMDFEER